MCIMRTHQIDTVGTVRGKYRKSFHNESTRVDSAKHSESQQPILMILTRLCALYFRQIAEGYFQIVFNHRTLMNVLHADFRYYLSVEQIDDAVGVTGVVLGVRYHHNRGSFLIQFAQ